MLEEAPVKGMNIDLNAVTPTDTRLIPINVNGIDLKVPGGRLNDPTAIAGKVNDKGVITFSRCKKGNEGKYAVLETPQGKLAFGDRFKDSLKGLVK